jgi:hypothetical protein
MPCVFCGNDDLTSEHVWPQWLARAAPAPKRQVIHHRRRIDRQKQVVDAPDRWSAPSYTVNVRAVCAQCNNGWMSELEQSVRPLLEPMLHDQLRILDHERQTLVATWVFKTSVMLEFTHPQERAIQSEASKSLYQHGQPPRNVTIWIASYRGLSLNAFYRHDVIQPRRTRLIDETVEDASATSEPGERERDEPLPAPIAYGITLGVRHVAFQLFGTTEPSLRIAHGGLAAKAFERIWPPRSPFTWPPPVGIDDDALSEVLDMFLRTFGGSTHSR